MSLYSSGGTKLQLGSWPKWCQWEEPPGRWTTEKHNLRWFWSLGLSRSAVSPPSTSIVQYTMRFWSQGFEALDFHDHHLQTEHSRIYCQSLWTASARKIDGIKTIYTKPQQAWELPIRCHQPCWDISNTKMQFFIVSLLPPRRKDKVH